MAVSRTLGAPSAPRGQRSGSKDPKASRSCNANATNAEHGKVEAAEAPSAASLLHSSASLGQTASMTILRGKGTPEALGALNRWPGRSSVPLAGPARCTLLGPELCDLV